MRSLFFVDHISNPLIIEGDEGHHAADVVRVKVGEELDVSDNSTLAHGRVTSVTKGRVELEILSSNPLAPSKPRVVVAQALIKGDSLSDSVDLMVQVGVDQIIPWISERSIVQWDQAKASKNVGKLNSVAFEACKQSRRPRMATVDSLHTSQELIKRFSQFDLVVALHESGREFLADDSFDGENILLIVGPEGGLSDQELTQFGAQVRRMGPTVIRSAQAGAVAAAVVFAKSSWRS